MILCSICREEMRYCQFGPRLQCFHGGIDSTDDRSEQYGLFANCRKYFMFSVAYNVHVILEGGMPDIGSIELHLSVHMTNMANTIRVTVLPVLNSGRRTV